MPGGSFSYLFGPVASRRFGRSLGVDLLGQRVCSFDCIFCEAGPTQACTMERAVYVPTEVVLAELRAWLGSGGDADVITLAGRGEPTLHLHFGRVIDAVHRICSIPVVLLSNGSLLHLEDVRHDAAKADIVKISLSGWDDASIGNVNRPAAGIRFDDYLSGMMSFRRLFNGELRLEIMFVEGMNTGEEKVAKLAACAERIGADKIELNTVERPPADGRAGAVSNACLQQYAGYFGPRAVIIGHSPVAACICSDERGDNTLSDQILGLLSRRGCTVDEMAIGLGCSHGQLQNCLRELAKNGLVRASNNRKDFFERVVSSR